MSFLSKLQSIEFDTNLKVSCIGVYNSIQAILHFLPREIPDYTDHGILHSENLIDYYIQFESQYGQNFFSSEEKGVIISAIILHDVGCIIDRDNHHEHSVKLIETGRLHAISDYYDAAMFTCVKNAILYHSSKENLNKVPNGIHPKIRLPLICAVFRLLDGLDLSKSRTKDLLYDILIEYKKLDLESIPFWEAHMNIENVLIIGDKIKLNVYDADKVQLLSDHLSEDLEDINQIFVQYGLDSLTVEIVIVPQYLIPEE